MLLADGVPAQDMTDADVSEGILTPGQETFTWTNLPTQSEPGTAITYTVEEVALNGYTSSPVDPASYEPNFAQIRDGKTIDNGSFEVTNTLKTVDVTVNKTWVGLEEGEVAPVATFELLANEQRTGQTRELAAGEETVVWEGLPVADANDSLIEYTVAEFEVEGFTSEIVADETGLVFTATNTKIVEEPEPTFVDVTVNKTWVGLEEGEVAPVVTFDLLADGVSLGDARELASGESQIVWSDLPELNAEGEAIAYTVAEFEVEGFTSEIVADESGLVFTATNTKIVEEPEPTPDPEPVPDPEPTPDPKPEPKDPELAKTGTTIAGLSIGALALIVSGAFLAMRRREEA